MGKLIDQFEQDQRRRGLLPNTMILRGRQLSLYEREVGLLNAATKESIEEWLDGRAISAKTRSCYLTTFSAFYKSGIKNGWIDEDPTMKIDRPRVHNGMPNPMPEDDLALALKKAKSPLMKCWLVLEAYAGLRCQEVAFLDASDIKWDDGLIHVRHGKGGKERYVPLSPVIAKALKAYDKEPRYTRATAFRASGDGRLWPRVTPASVSQRINRFLRSLDISRSAHKLRHRFGTRVYASSGSDILTTQRLLGHANPTTTAGYANVSSEAAKTAVLNIDGPVELEDDNPIDQ